MCRRIHDIIGHTFGRLTVESYSHKDATSRNYFNCVCSCGKSKTVQQSNLLSGRSSSCGCSRKHAVVPMPENINTQPPSNTTRTEEFCVGMGMLPAFTRSHWDAMSNDEMKAFRLVNTTFLVEPHFLKKGDRVVIKENGMCATADMLVTLNSCFTVTLDDGTSEPIFSLDDVWKLHQAN